MSHFSAIGFIVETEEDYANLINEVFPLAKPYSTHGNLGYFCYTDESGFQIWFFIDKTDNQIICATPCFLPKTTQKVGINTVVPIENGQFGDGMAYGWINVKDYDKNEGWGDGDYPLVIDLPDYLNHHDSEQVQTAFLTLFAEDVDIFADKHTFRFEQEQQEMNFSSECFMPSGMFIDEDNAQSTAKVLTAGTVLASEKRLNNLTNIEFYWCRVSTYGGEYEAVYPLEMFENLPQIGNIIFGNYWLTGRFAQ